MSGPIACYRFAFAFCDGGAWPLPLLGGRPWPAGQRHVLRVPRRRRRVLAVAVGTSTWKFVFDSVFRDRAGSLALRTTSRPSPTSVNTGTSGVFARREHACALRAGLDARGPATVWIAWYRALLELKESDSAGTRHLQHRTGRTRRARTRTHRRPDAKQSVSMQGSRNVHLVVDVQAGRRQAAA
jgi:hypothetical protein